MKHRKSDILWKVILEEVFADLLRFVYPDADQVYDMARGFHFLDKELAELNPEPDEEKDSRFADKLVQVYHRDGLEEWVLLHVEVQGDTSDRDDFAERMYTYFYRIRDKHHLLVSALAIFTGQDGNDMPARYSYEYRGTRLTYEYPSLSIRAFSDDELEDSPNPFAQVVIAARVRLWEGKVSEDELLKIKLTAARRLFAKGFDDVTVEAIFTFLRNYVLFDDPEKNRIFDTEIEETNKGVVMNTKDIIKSEEREEMVRRMLEDRVLNLPVEKIATLANVTVKDVEEIKKQMGIK